MNTTVFCFSLTLLFKDKASSLMRENRSSPGEATEPLFSLQINAGQTRVPLICFFLSLKNVQLLCAMWVNAVVQDTAQCYK